jgi:transposase-like protein
MAKALFSQPRFTNDDAAREHLEMLRWPSGPVCPHCGGTERNVRITGKTARAGLLFCGDCRTQFTVTVGTVFERSKVPLHKWVLATHLMCSSKKGMSAHQLHRTIGVTYKTAWFMAHRIRESMKADPNPVMMGGDGNGGTIEADETFWGNKSKPRTNKRGWAHSMKVFTLVERGGKARSFQVPAVNAKTLRPILLGNVHPIAKLMTDDGNAYRGMSKHFQSHEVVNHSHYEYARGDVSTNVVEGFFSILKRGLVGTFHHVGEQHLHR